jgi:ubiquinone/menaquinone biosynthesis C-methylase UbiE
VLDYNAEADQYDASRGGTERAAAAARAIEHLLPAPTRILLDVACGTGIVTRRLSSPGRFVAGVDRSPGMARMAASRLPHAVILGDATRLPVASGSVDAVVIIWLLHLLTDAAPVLAEAARVLRPGGVLITTVDKNQSTFAVPSDVAEVTRESREPYAQHASDRFERVVAQAEKHGLRPAGETTFRGTGQGRTPPQWREQLLAGRMPWFRPPGHHHTSPNTERAEENTEGAEALLQALAELPDQDAARPDPVYRLIALTAA